MENSKKNTLQSAGGKKKKTRKPYLTFFKISPFNPVRKRGPHAYSHNTAAIDRMRSFRSVSCFS